MTNNHKLWIRHIFNNQIWTGPEWQGSRWEMSGEVHSIGTLEFLRTSQMQTFCKKIISSRFPTSLYRKLSIPILNMPARRCWSNYCPETCKCASSNCCLPISSTKVQLSVWVLKFLLRWIIMFDVFCVIVVRTTYEPHKFDHRFV